MLTAARLGDEASELRAACDLVACIAGNLGLRPEDVYLTWTVPSITVLGTALTEPWPVMIIHGRPRPAATVAMEAAGRRAAEIWNAPRDTVWVQWIAPESQA